MSDDWSLEGKRCFLEEDKDGAYIRAEDKFTNESDFEGVTIYYEKENIEILHQKLIEDIKKTPIEITWVGAVQGKQVSKSLDIQKHVAKIMIDLINKRFGVDK